MPGANQQRARGSRRPDTTRCRVLHNRRLQVRFLSHLPRREQPAVDAAPCRPRGARQRVIGRLGWWAVGMQEVWPARCCWSAAGLHSAGAPSEHSQVGVKHRRLADRQMCPRLFAGFHCTSAEPIALWYTRTAVALRVPRVASTRLPADARKTIDERSRVTWSVPSGYSWMRLPPPTEWAMTGL